MSQEDTIKRKILQREILNEIKSQDRRDARRDERNAESDGRLVQFLLSMNNYKAQDVQLIR